MSFDIDGHVKSTDQRPSFSGSGGGGAAGAAVGGSQPQIKNHLKTFEKHF